MRTLLTLALLTTATVAEAAWRPAKQAMIVTAPEGMECIPCEKLQEHIRAEYEQVRVGPERDAHFIVRRGSPELRKFPQVWYYDAEGRLTHRLIGYQHSLYYDKSLPERERLAALKRIVERHPRFIPDRPPMAPPAKVASLSAPVRTAELVTLADDGTVDSQSLATSPNLFDERITTVQYAPYADCSGSQAYSMPYSDCGGGGIGGGGGGDFWPPAQSMYVMPQQQYAPRYVMRPNYSPYRYASPYAGGGVNQYSLLNFSPSLQLFNGGSLFGGGLFGQRAYYAPRRSYRAAYSPFSFASYGSRMVCANGVCYVQ